MAEESHRLKPMVDNYDQALFNELFQKTAALRRSLVHGIDPKRFGVDSEELLSWFSVKFIYIFNKYCNDKPDRLLGYIINGLKMYKRRLILEAYADKNKVYATNPLEDYLGHGEYEEQREAGTSTLDESIFGVEDPYEDKDYLLGVALSFLKNELSDDAMFLLEIQLNPPPFILAKLEEANSNNLNKIPDVFIAEYMDIAFDENVIRYFAELRGEIKQGIQKANRASSTGLIYEVAKV